MRGSEAISLRVRDTVMRVVVPKLTIDEKDQLTKPMLTTANIIEALVR
jgi:hypothetical protein